MEWRSVAERGRWVEPDTRDSIITFVNYWQSGSHLSQYQILKQLGVSRGKFCQWQTRYQLPNQHNSKVPKGDWVNSSEELAIISYCQANYGEGYRRLCYMMMDDDIAYVSPSSVYRIMRKNSLLFNRATKVSKKGTGFNQPLAPHKHWHTDVTFIKITGKIYCLMFVLDGYSRAILSYGLYDQMTSAEVSLVVQKAREIFPNEHPRIISDNGKQYVGKEFKAFVISSGMTHVTTSPYYPQSNGKLERFHGTIKKYLRTKVLLDCDDAKKVIEQYIAYYNTKRLHSAINYITPEDRLKGNEKKIIDTRNQKLASARQIRREHNLIVLDQLAA